MSIKKQSQRFITMKIKEKNYFIIRNKILNCLSYVIKIRNLIIIKNQKFD